MTAHTRGPWHQNSYQVEADDGSLICHMSGWRGPKFTEANARLIAAAPTMHEEMQRFLEVIERAEADSEVWTRLTAGTGIATANAYRAAIAKAKGEQL